VSQSVNHTHSHPSQILNRVYVYKYFVRIKKNPFFNAGNESTPEACHVCGCFFNLWGTNHDVLIHLHPKKRWFITNTAEALKECKRSAAFQKKPSMCMCARVRVRSWRDGAWSVPRPRQLKKGFQSPRDMQSVTASELRPTCLSWAHESKKRKAAWQQRRRFHWLSSSRKRRKDDTPLCFFARCVSMCLCVYESKCLCV